MQELESIVDVKALSIGRPCEPRKGLPNFIHNVRTFPVVGRVMTVCTTETGRDETQNKGHLVNQVQQKSGRLGVPSPRSKAGCSRYSSHDTNMGSAPKAAYGQSPRWIRSRARQDRMVFQILCWRSWKCIAVLTSRKRLSGRKLMSVEPRRSPAGHNQDVMDTSAALQRLIALCSDVPDQNVITHGKNSGRSCEMPALPHADG